MENIRNCYRGRKNEEAKISIIMMKKEKNIVFWKIFEIDIEGKKKLIKKCRSRGIDDSNAERKNTAFWKIFEIVIEEEKIN